MPKVDVEHRFGTNRNLINQALGLAVKWVQMFDDVALCSPASVAKESAGD